MDAQRVAANARGKRDQRIGTIRLDRVFGTLEVNLLGHALATVCGRALDSRCQLNLGHGYLSVWAAAASAALQPVD